MTNGLLLDSHVLLWLDSNSIIEPETRFLIGDAGASARLFVSDISLWELGVAQHKKSLERRPNLRGLSIRRWFNETTDIFGVRTIRVSRAVAVEAAEVPGVYGSGDPGDCFLIATARVRKLTLVTRDAKILKLAEREPEYLSVVAC